VRKRTVNLSFRQHQNIGFVAQSQPAIFSGPDSSGSCHGAAYQGESLPQPPRNKETVKFQTGQSGLWALRQQQQAEDGVGQVNCAARSIITLEGVVKPGVSADSDEPCSLPKVSPRLAHHTQAGNTGLCQAPSPMRSAICLGVSRHRACRPYLAASRIVACQYAAVA
jgi:hypothetical protein